MQRVLIIAENSLQQERLCAALNFDRTVQLTTANLRQINPKTLKAFKQSDLIILEDTSEQGDPRTTEYLLSSLKATGLPIVLLPSVDERFDPDKEPLVLNLTEQTVAQPGLAALINKIRQQYSSKNLDGRNGGIESVAPPQLLSALPPEALAESQRSPAGTAFTHAFEPSPAPPRPDTSSKVTYALTAIGRITKQLREPLSNMNLAIHMLGRVQSIEERDRYVKLLREEYQRELQLVTELENLQASLLANL